jgi:hypothetical protein
MPRYKLTPRTHHSPRTLGVQRKEQDHSFKHISHRAHHSHNSTLHGRGTLKEHSEVIAVVEEYLARGCWERATTQVVDHRPWLNDYAPARQLHAPLQVNLLHVGKEVLVEAAKALKHLTATA